MMRFKFILAIISAIYFSCGASDPAAELHSLIDDIWEYRIQQDPLFATSVGRHEFNNKLPDVSEQATEKFSEKMEDFLDRLQDIDREQLNRQDRINYTLIERDLENEIAHFKFRAYLMPFNADSGFHTYFAHLSRSMPFRTAIDYENYIARLQAAPAYFNQHIKLLKKGIDEDITLPQVVLSGFNITTRSHIVNHWEKSVFFQPFQKKPDSVLGQDWQELVKAGQEVIMDSVVAAYQNFDDFISKEYIPNCRTSIGASRLPKGTEYYAQRAKYYTTLNLSADEMHQIGLSEVARIKSEMHDIIKKVGFRGDFPAFLKFLRTDPRFYAKSEEELLKEASYIAKRMDAKLPSLFKTLPRLPYGVAPVPEHLAPKYTAGRYVGPSLDSTEPGYYWVNTYSLKDRPLYALEALSFHEAVPGHHLQISLSRELEGLPDFRRFTYLSAFGEGWGLYSEWLGLEAGFYTDPYSDFGRLTYEMWRACRLVVDTGLHTKDWTRKQAIDYLASNTALSLHEVKTEVDRYISWPAQALSYKMGDLKIKELRKNAENALGHKFDVREFHDVILRNGAIPLSVLEEEVSAYLASRTASN